MRQTLLLLALLAAFPPLATDMYLPAIPHLKQLWDQPLMIVNLTLIGFFLAYCLGMLVYGPLSDRFGRRRPLLAGIAIFIAASLLCALAGNIAALIAARILQAAGAAAASALSLAMCKDLFESRQRARILAYIAVIVALAPMLAPIVGGWVIHYSSWRWVFILQGSMGLVAWVGVYRMAEPLTQFRIVTAGDALKVYLGLLRNRRFTGLMLAISSLILPFFGFLAACSDIYMGRFGMDERAFGYFFAFNALAFMCGPIAFGRLLRWYSTASLLTAAFAGIGAAGALMAVLPHRTPWSLALPMWATTFCLGLSRPPSNNLMLDQVDRDVGAASALIIFTFMTIGAAGMGLVSLDWPDKITVLGVLGGLTGAGTLAFWLKARHRFLPSPRDD